MKLTVALGAMVDTPVGSLVIVMDEGIEVGCDDNLVFTDGNDVGWEEGSENIEGKEVGWDEGRASDDSVGAKVGV